MDNLVEAMEALNHKYFGLAFVLLPEELMATQLLIDASSRLIVSLKDKLPEGDEFEEHYVLHLIELARIRQKHFAYKKSDAFFKLSFDERAVLFLRDKKHLHPSFIAAVLGCREENVLGLTHKARASLLNHAGDPIGSRL